MLGFMDAYSGYNQIMVHPADEPPNTFYGDKDILFHKVVPIKLVSPVTTYQRMINKVLNNMWMTF